MPTKRIPAILSRSVDPRKDVDQQYSERIRALFKHYEIDFNLQERNFELLLALIVERFPKAFDVQLPPPDPRLKVPKVSALGELVAAVIDDREPNLTDPLLRKLASSTKSWLSARNHSRTQKHCCEALSKLDGPWRNIAPATLRDNLQRLPGARKRRELRAGLRRCIQEIEASTGGKPISADR